MNYQSKENHLLKQNKEKYEVFKNILLTKSFEEKVSIINLQRPTWSGKDIAFVPASFVFCK